ncbi:MAG TPA: hypothetical protein VGJ55_19205 [Pyrinomonadaceae bacterium]
MYKANFCAECGTRLGRAIWRPWTSRRFCDDCGVRFRKEELTVPFLLCAVLLIAGFSFGRYLRPSPPPLIVQRFAKSPLSDIPIAIASGAPATQLPNSTNGSAGNPVERNSQGNNEANNQSGGPEEVIYICGARTKKGTPCSRRVHGPVRCWQHKGMPAMLPQEKLLVKG